MLLLAPAFSWCQYFYKTYPKERTATFYSLRDSKNSVIISMGKKCEFWECSEVTNFDYLGNIIWNTEFIHTDVGSSTLMLQKDTLYVGGNYYPDQAKSVINRLTTDGVMIDEHVYTDPLNRISDNLMNQLLSNNQGIYLSGGTYVNGVTRATIYSIDQEMKLKEILIDTSGYASSISDAHFGPDAQLTYFIRQSEVFAPRDRRRIEKYDQDLKLVWKYQPPDSLLYLGNDIYLHGTVLRNGNIFFTYYKMGWNDRLPNLRCIDTLTKTTTWEFDFPNISSHEREILRTKELKNGDILISGSYSTLATTPKIRSSPWLMLLDRNGNRKWERTFVELGSDGQDKTGTLWDAIELDNGDLMACGFVLNNNKWDPLLIRTDAYGCIDQGQTNCPQVQIIDLMSGAVDEIGGKSLKVYPNPSSGLFTIKIPEFIGNANVVVTDINGKLLFSKEIVNSILEEIDLTLYPSGRYNIDVYPEANVERVFYRVQLVKL
jgi:hypothetical protein